MKKLATGMMLALMLVACGGGAEEGMEDEGGMAEESGMMADTAATEGEGMMEEGGMMEDTAAMEGEMGDEMGPDTGMAPPDTSEMRHE